MAKPIANPRFFARDTAGADLAGGYVLTYHAGTTTAKPVYADAGESAAMPGPATGANAGKTGFVLDSYGEASVYWATSKYKLRFFRADDTLVHEIDNFDPGGVTNTVDAENAIANGSFEITASGNSSPEEWELTADGTLPQRVTNDASHGEASLMFTGPGGTTSGGSALQREYLPVTPGRPLDVLWQMKASAPSLRCVVRMHWYDATRSTLSGSPDQLYDESAANPITWTELHRRVTPPAGTCFARLELRGVDANSDVAGFVWFDGVLVRSAFSDATQTTSGFLPAGDKQKLDRMQNVTTVTGNITLAPEDGGLVLLDATLANISTTLPPAADVPGGLFSFVRLDSGANAVSVQRTGTDTIDGDTSFLLPGHYQTRTLISNGSDAWHTMGRERDTPLPRGYIYGLTLGNNATDAAKDIDFFAGECRDSTNAHNLVLTATIVKQIDIAWAAGSHAGGMFSGTVAADTWYHCFVIRKDTDGSADCGFDTSITAANIPSGYSAYRRVGSILTDATPDIIAFSSIGDGRDIEYLWYDPPLDVNTTTLGTTATAYTLSVPPDIRAMARGNSTYASNVVYVRPDDVIDEAPSTTIAPLHMGAGSASVFTNTSSQIEARAALASTTFRWTTQGWKEHR